MTHQFTATILRNGDMDAAYIIVPINIREVYGKGRLKVEATFNGHPYSGSVVNMGVRDAEGNVCYILGMPKAIRRAIGAAFGDEVEVCLHPVP